jgi:MerR family transcriptional regulator, thiopeptide resistance regulator
MELNQKLIDSFIDKALMAYFEKENIIISELESV